MTAALAERLFPTMTRAAAQRDEVRELVGDPDACRALFERAARRDAGAPFPDDTVRGVVPTDALIGTFAAADDASLQQNRCFLYHVIGGGTGDWDVPVGGMGAVTGALADAAQRGGRGSSPAPR